MAKLRSTEKLNWGGANPFIDNFIEIEMKEIFANDTIVKYQITDTVIGERTILDENQEEQISEFNLIQIRRKTIDVTPEVYQQMYDLADIHITANYENITRFERENLRSKVALWIYFTNDKIEDGNGNLVCLYNTQPNQWEII